MFNGKINELSMAMFNSYVSLPEGNNFLSLSIVLYPQYYPSTVIYKNPLDNLPGSYFPLRERQDDPWFKKICFPIMTMVEDM